MLVLKLYGMVHHDGCVFCSVLVWCYNDLITLPVM